MAAPKAVLVVEANEVAREGLAALRREGYAVALAANGREALDALRAGPAASDLILVDMLLPVLDGWGLLKALRADPALAAVPVVLLGRVW